MPSDPGSKEVTRAARDDAAGLPGDARARRAQLAAALAATRREFALEARQGRGGRDAQVRHAARMDDVVQQLVEAARVHTSRPLVVCALGGYGRRTLCLHSDIDLMILFESSIGRDEERFVTIGLAADGSLLVAWAPGGAGGRVLSARRATRRERINYEEGP